MCVAALAWQAHRDWQLVAVGNRDAVRQGLTGFVVNRLDEGLVCLRRLLLDAELNQRFSQAAREDAKKRFSNASFRARLLRLYRLEAQPLPRTEAAPAAALPTARLHSVGDTGFSETVPAAGGAERERERVRAVLRRVVNG